MRLPKRSKVPKAGRKILVSTVLFFLFQSGFAQKKRNPITIPANYQKHLSASKKVGVKRLENGKQLNAARKNGKLLSVKPMGRGYQIMRLKYSQPVLIFDAKQILRQISSDFFKKSRQSTLTVTSLTRTVQT